MLNRDCLRLKRFSTEGRSLLSIEASKASKQNDFRMIFLEGIDEALRAVFGETAARAILLHLETKKGLKREDISSNPEGFSSGLADLLSSYSARVLETHVIRILCSKLMLEYDEKQTLRFADHVQELRNRFEGEKK